MKPSLKFGSLSVFIVLAAFGPDRSFNLAAQEENRTLDLRARFLKEAPSQWEKYRALTKHFQGWYSLSLTQTLGNFSDKRRFERKLNDKCMLVQWSSETITNQKRETTFELFAINPRYSFTLRRSKPSASWTLAEIGRGNNPPSLGKLPGPLEGIIGVKPNFLIRLHTEFLSEMLAKPEFKVISCRWVPQENEKRVEVHFDYSHEVKKSTENSVQRGKLLLDPQRFWSLCSYDVQIRTVISQGTMKMQVLSFDETQPSLPVPKKAFIKTETSSDGIRNQQEWSYEFNLKVPSQLPADEEFRLSYYNLPEPKGVTWPKPTPYYLWFIALGIVSMVLGAFLRHWLRKRGAGNATGAITPGPKSV